MNTKLILLFLLGWAGIAYGQETEIDRVKREIKAKQEELGKLESDTEKANEKKLEALEAQKKAIIKAISEIRNQSEGETASRISFVMGIGASTALSKVYQMPIVSTLDNKVKMEEGQRGRIGATFGLVYTPYIYRVSDMQSPEGYLVSKGWSYVAFFNPLNLVKSSNLEENFSLSNFGVGVGYKTVAGIGIYAVGEIYSVKQPKEWFIKEFSDGTKPYAINGEIQNSFSSTDESIFRNKLIPYFGVKVCYSFDIIKGFNSSVTPK